MFILENGNKYIFISVIFLIFCFILKNNKFWRILRPTIFYPRPTTFYPRPTTVSQTSLAIVTSSFI